MRECRTCKGSNLFLFLPLGDHPPANGFLTAESLGEPEARFPLDAHVCLDCGLIQVADQIPPDFFRHYVYVPGASPQMRDHFVGLAADLDARFDRTRGPVVDIGCNDGTFLRAARALGWATLGVDPATNIVEAVSADGIDVVNEYFTVPIAKEMRASRGPAAVIVTNNTFHHVGDLDEFMGAVTCLLADDGVFVVEVPHAKALVAQNEFDGIYHEHVSQLCIKSFVDLYARFGMRVADVTPLEVHGGSVRVFAVRGGVEETPAAVLAWVREEQAAGLFEKSTYVDLAERVRSIREDLMRVLHDLKAKGMRLAAYGASARGNTVLNYYGIGPDLIDYIADRNELKQGLYSPGMHIPCVGPDRLVQDRPDYVLLLAWNFADEVLRQQSEYLARGGRFILPIPEVRIVDAENVA
jgi:SAM-dependent methyltransferase